MIPRVAMHHMHQYNTFIRTIIYQKKSIYPHLDRQSQQAFVGFPSYPNCPNGSSSAVPYLNRRAPCNLLRRKAPVAGRDSFGIHICEKGQNNHCTACVNANRFHIAPFHRYWARPDYRPFFYNCVPVREDDCDCVVAIYLRLSQTISASIK